MWRLHEWQAVAISGNDAGSSHALDG